jgi:hypothetical protein
MLGAVDNEIQAQQNRLANSSDPVMFISSSLDKVEARFIRASLCWW